MNENVLECALIAAMDEEIVMYSEMESQNHHMFSHRYKKRKQKGNNAIIYFHFRILFHYKRLQT